MEAIKIDVDKESLAETVFAECCARARRAPALVFLVPGTIPVLPGSDFITPCVICCLAILMYLPII